MCGWMDGKDGLGDEVRLRSLRLRQRPNARMAPQWMVGYGGESGKWKVESQETGVGSRLGGGDTEESPRW